MYTYVPIIITIIIRGLLAGGGFLWAFALSIPNGARGDEEEGEGSIRCYFLNHLLSNWSIDYEPHVVLSRNYRKYQLVE